MMLYDVNVLDWVVVSNILYFPVHIWDVHIFQDGYNWLYKATNQLKPSLRGHISIGFAKRTAGATGRRSIFRRPWRP